MGDRAAAPRARGALPSRLGVVVALALKLTPMAASAQAEALVADPPVTAATLTAEEAVRRALRRAPLSDALDGAVEVERGTGRALGAWPNPQVTYLREQTFGPLGTGEDYLSLSQVIDLGDRRGLRADAGERRASAAAHDGEATRAQVAADARVSFYESMYRRERAATLRAWVGRIDAALGIVGRRTARGDTALYDRRRLERERAVAVARSEAEEAALAHARARLAAVIGASDASLRRVTLEGQLLPEDEPAALSTLCASAGHQHGLLALDERLRATDLERVSATRWWLPELRLEAGWKGVDAGAQGRTDGFLLGATLTLPLWDRSTGQALTARGEARSLRGRRALLAFELQGEVTGLHAEATRLTLAARRFRQDSSAASGDLVRIATAGYEGGEMAVLELLDAYRGAADDALTALDLEQSARRARVELDRLTTTEPP